MNETINDRIELLVRERFGGNKAAFAKAIGMPPTGLSSYLGKQRRSKPNVDMVTNIAVNLGVDPMWLLTGIASPRNEVHTEGNYSPASVSGNINIGANDELQERIKLLELLLEEKERTIQILLSQQEKISKEQ